MEKREASARNPECQAIPLWYILIITVLAFSPVFKSGFTNWDDQKHVYQNSSIYSLDGSHLREIFTSSVNKTYIPLTSLSFAVERHFFGFNPFVHHTTNLLLHLGVVALVFRFASRAGLTSGAAALAALLFAVHPMHVESVAWITERKDVLYALFYMLALNSYLTYLRAGRLSSYLWTIPWGLLSLLAKPMALSLPLVLFVCDGLYGRKLTWKVCLEKIPHCLIVISIALITYLQHLRLPGQELGPAVLIWVWTLTFYIQKFFLSFVFVPLYQLPEPVSIFNPSYVAAFAVLFLMICAAARLRKNRWFIFAVSYYFASIFFLLRYDNAADVTIVADRFMYLPSLGACLLFGVWADKILDGPARGGKSFFVRKAALFCLAAWLTALGVKTYAQTGIWKDSVTLWNYVIHRSPGAVTAYANRADAYAMMGEVELAEADYRKLAKIKLEHARRHYQKAQGYYQRKKYDAALLHYANALFHNPRYAAAHIGRGDIFQIRRQFEDALSEYNKALDIRPGDQELYMVRGHVYQQQGQYDRAIADFTKVLEINPSRAQAYYRRAAVYGHDGQDDPALRDFQRAVEMNPQDADVYFERGNFYLERKQYAAAAADYTKTLEMRPQEMKVRYNRAAAYERSGEYPLALADYDRVLEINPGHVGALLRRAEIYYQTRDLNRAWEEYTKIMRMSASVGEAYSRRSRIYKDRGDFKRAFLDALVARYLGETIEEGYWEELKDAVKQPAGRL